MLLILRQFFQFLPVCGEYLGFGNEPHISPVLLHDRQVPGIRILELFHHTVHLLALIDIGRRRFHIIVNMDLIIQIRLEHILSDILKRDIALQMPP